MRRHRRSVCATGVAALAAAAAAAGVVVAAVSDAVAATADASSAGPCGDAPVAPRHRVAVLGAGVAGATVARGLAAAGVKDVVILEGGAAVGGRLRQVPLGNVSVEIGANWMQGYKDENSFSDYVSSVGLQGVPTEYDSVTLFRADGSPIPDEEADPLWVAFDIALGATYNLSAALPPNRTMDVAAALLAAGGWEATSPAAIAIERFGLDFEYAVPASQISVRDLSPIYAPGTVESDEFFVTDTRGFAVVVQSLLADAGISDSSIPSARLRLNTTVMDLHYTSSGVCITTAGGEKMVADYAVSTFSVGVLQAAMMVGPTRPAEALSITPPLPMDKQLAIAQMKLADYVKVWAMWDEPVLTSDDGEFLVPTSCTEDRWVAVHNLNAVEGTPLSGLNVMLLTATSSYGRAIGCQPLSVTAEQIGEVLSNLKGYDVPPPRHVVVGRWREEPRFRGSYSVVPPGWRDEERVAFNEPAGRLYFAGEAHAEGGVNGYVQGAWNSGLKTVTEMLAAMEAEKEGK
ncbi:hypothetical protein MMPV_000459 [Pyropia vietnamensis]